MKRILTVFLFLFWMSSQSFAQERIVTGKVSSKEDGTTLPGVNVILKGTNKGTTTDADGTYKLSVPAAGGSLIFSFIGLQTSEIAIGDRSIVDIELSLDVTQLSEVIVVGYGTQSRKKVTSAQSTITGANISNLASSSFDSQLAGRSAGVQVTVGTGVIGSAPIINIRGVNSLSSGTFPLVVIDGVPMNTGNQSSIITTNPLADINPNDIETYDILKDGAATAIYGSRAANGVILITTKRGSKNKGKATVDFSVTTGFSEAIDKFDLLNSEEFILIANEKLTNSGVPIGAFPNTEGIETDWQDVILRKGNFSNYNIGISGAGEATNYYFSVGYQKQQGAVVANDFDRLSFRSNIDHKLNKFIEAGTTLTVTRSNTTGLNTSPAGLSGNIASGLRMFPNVSPYDASNPTGYNLSPDNAALGLGPNTRNIDNNYTNSKFVLDKNKYISSNDRVLGSIYGKLNLADGLSFKSQYGIDYTGVQDFQTLDPRHGDGRSSNGAVTQTYRRVLLWNTQNTLNYSHDFGNHGFDIVAGAEFQKTTISSFSAGGANFSDRFFIQDNLISGQFVTATAFGSYAQNGFASYFSRLNYSLSDKYLIGLSIRNDALSNLPKATRNGSFFGASAGYRLSEEQFFQSLGLSKLVSDVKFRASYAQVGNTQIGFFPYQSVYGAGKYGNQNGAGFSQAGNPNLKWETSNKLNLGADMGFLNNKLSLAFDYFKNDVDGLILNAPTVPSAGIPSNAINKNVGVVSNSGLEFTVNATPVNSKNLTWNVSANFTSLKSEVKKLAKNTLGEPIPLVNNYQITREGDIQNSIYGYTYAGVNPSNGNPLYVKGNGAIVQRNGNTGAYSYYNADDQSNESVVIRDGIGAALDPKDITKGGDRKILGSSLPTWFGGLTNTLNYKGFSLEIFIRFQGGNKVYNQTKQDNLLNQDFTNGGKELLNRWTPENQNTDIPKLWLNRNDYVNQSGVATSRFIEDGSFARLQNIVFSYSIPKSFLNKTGDFKLSSVRVFAQAQNILTFTKYTGIDPEMGASGSQVAGTSSQGIDNNTSPVFRTITLGINVGL